MGRLDLDWSMVLDEGITVIQLGDAIAAEVDALSMSCRHLAVISGVYSVIGSRRAAS
jgi:hypothetical protein